MGFLEFEACEPERVSLAKLGEEGYRLGGRMLRVRCR